MEVGDLSFLFDHVYMIGGLPSLPGRVTLSAGVAFCHVNNSRWGSPPSRGRVPVTFATTSSNVTPGPRRCNFASKRGPFFDHG